MMDEKIKRIIEAAREVDDTFWPKSGDIYGKYGAGKEAALEDLHDAVKALND